MHASDKRTNNCDPHPAYSECDTSHPELHPTGSCGELDSAASFRDNVEEVDSFRVVKFKDGVKVDVPSDINLDSSRVLEFIYNSAPKAQNPSREDSEANKNLLSMRNTQGSCESCAPSKNLVKNPNFNKNSNFQISPNFCVDLNTQSASVREGQDGSPDFREVAPDSCESYPDGPQCFKSSAAGPQSKNACETRRGVVEITIPWVRPTSRVENSGSNMPPRGRKDHPGYPRMKEIFVM